MGRRRWRSKRSRKSARRGATATKWPRPRGERDQPIDQVRERSGSRVGNDGEGDSPGTRSPGDATAKREESALVRRVFAKDRAAAVEFLLAKEQWVRSLVLETVGESAVEPLFDAIQGAFAQMAGKGLEAPEQSAEQLQRTIRGICQIQCEGFRLETRGLMVRYAERDLEASKEILNGLVRVLKDSLSRIIRHKKAFEGEDDILQTVFCALWRNLGEFKLQASYPAMVDWVYKVTRNQTAQWWRDRDLWGLGPGVERRLTRPVLPDDVGVDRNDPEVISEWLDAGIAEASRRTEERFLAATEWEESGNFERDDEAGRDVDEPRDAPDSREEHEAECSEGSVYPDAPTGSDLGHDVDEASGLPTGSYEASVRAREVWCRGVTHLLGEPIEALLARLEGLVSRDVLAGAAEKIRGLPDRLQQTFRGWLVLGVLHKCGGEEIARFLGMNYSSYRGWLRRAKRACSVLKDLQHGKVGVD